MTDNPDNVNVDGNVQGGNVNIGGTQNFFGDFNITSNIYTAPAIPSQRDTGELSDDDFDQIIEAFDATSSRLANIRSTFFETGIQIQRSEVAQIVNWVNSPKPDPVARGEQFALVTGKAGQGKSVVMQQLNHALRNSPHFVLAIKADDLATVSRPLLSSEDLQNLLQMPGPIEQCIRLVSKTGLCIVLIDQLDTLSLTLNTDEQSLRIVINLIASGLIG